MHIQLSHYLASNQYFLGMTISQLQAHTLVSFSCSRYDSVEDHCIFLFVVPVFKNMSSSVVDNYYQVH